MATLGNILIKSDSVIVRTFSEPLHPAAHLTLDCWEPQGLTIKRLVPNDSIFERIDAVAHCHNAKSTTTDKIPIMIPSELSPDLNLLAINESNAFFKYTHTDIFFLLSYIKHFLSLYILSAACSLEFQALLIFLSSLIWTLSINPSLICTLCFAKAAISCSCVTITIVFPSLFNFVKIFMISILVLVSRFPVGSSASIKVGLVTIARAIAILCCSHPESSLGLLWTLCANHTFVKAPIALSCSSHLGTHW